MNICGEIAHSQTKGSEGPSKGSTLHELGRWNRNRRLGSAWVCTVRALIRGGGRIEGDPLGLGRW